MSEIGYSDAQIRINSALDAGLRESVGGAAQNSVHRVVNRLHLPADKGDTVVHFSLTIKIEGVKTESFFDNFLSFPGWCGVRGSSRVALRIARCKEKAGEGL